ncbi:MAG: DUF58 domain-containing protein [Bacteroidales bacterium]|nr:DUF58 domain-containing protein [Bacteroidales bacterium]MBQ3983354.1 DUF58 domain-containing protein [Bacteroidales bacterium]
MFEDLEKYKSLDFYARQIVEGYLTGLHRSPFHGFSVEFAEHRQYTTGESTRNIDWKLYGRTNKLFVKRFEEETNLRCQLVIDHSGSMLFPTERHGNLQNPNKLTFACYATAVLSELLVRQRDAFGLSLISNGIDLQTDCRSNRVHQQYLLSLLEKELLQHTPDKAGDKTQLKDTQISEALHLIAEQLHKRSLVVIFTDALVKPSDQDPLMDALRHLRHCKHEVILFHTLHLAQEVQFTFPNRPTEFIDLETGRQLKVNPAEVADKYREKMAHQTADIKQHAIRYRIDYQPVDIAQGFDQVMLPYLLKRSRHQ